MENMDIDLKETKKMVSRMEEKLNKCAALENKVLEEDITMDVRYVNETEGLKMIIDSWAPLEIVSDG